MTSSVDLKHAALDERIARMAIDRRKTNLLLIGLTASLCGAGGIGRANACGYDGVSAAAIAARYPRAAEVAAALRHPANAQLLDQKLVSPTFVNLMGYHRAIRRLQRLRDSLEHAVLDQHLPSPAFSLLLVEAGLWTRYAPDAAGVSIMPHTAGPQATDALVFTGEAVIEAIASGRLSAAEAFRRRLVVVDGAADAGNQVAAWLRPALGELAEGL
jgi:hypothetical protein